MIEISTRIGCSLDCRFCPQKTLVANYFRADGRTGVMPFETFARCIDKVPAGETVVFSGMAEPWLNPDCTRMMKYAQAKGHPLGVFTTLVGMSANDYAALKDAAPAELCLHIPDEEGNAHFPTDEAFWSLLDRVLADIASGKLTVTSLSSHGRIHPRIRSRVTALSAPVIDEMHDRAGILEDDQVRHEGPMKRGAVVCTRCDGAGLNNNVLLPDGTVVLCCMDYGLKHPLGNLLTDSYDAVMNGSAKQHCRELLASERNGDIICRHCISCKPAWQWKLYKNPVLRRLYLAVKG